MKSVLSIRSSSFRQPSRQINIMGMMQDLVRKAMPVQNTTIGTARALLYNCKQQADNSLWYTNGKIGTEFRSRHTVLMTHAWLIHKRLLKEGKEGQKLQECMFDELWEDTCARLRAIGISEISINKHLGEVQSFSFKYCCELDVAVAKTDEAEVIDDLGGAIWRNVYIAKEDMDENHVLDFARYLRREHLTIMDVPMDAIRDGRIKWGTPPRWLESNAANRNKSVNTSINKIETAEGEWMEALSVGGRVYYWNTVTRKSVWERPAAPASPSQ